MPPRDNLRPRSGEVRQTATYVLGCSDAQRWLAQTTASDVLEPMADSYARHISSSWRSAILSDCAPSNNNPRMFREAWISHLDHTAMLQKSLANRLGISWVCQRFEYMHVHLDKAECRHDLERLDRL